MDTLTLSRPTRNPRPVSPKLPMGIILKTPEQIEKIRRAGRLVHEALRRCEAACVAGATTAQVNAAAQGVLAENPGAEGMFLNYPSPAAGVTAFPAVTCISVNEQVVHGIPGSRVIRAGDLVSVDCGIRYEGWCGDSATTIEVGAQTGEHRRLCEATRHVLRIAIENIRPGRRWSRIARQMQDYAERAGFSVIRDYVGHGVGATMHEEPKVPNFVSDELRRKDFELRPGMVLAVEPMCATGTYRVKTLDDGWTVVTADGGYAAHYEHTLVVTETGCDILTDGR